MKTRHPPGVRRDPGHLHLRQHVHHPQHRHVRHHQRRRVLQLPPLLHRQAEDPRHRRPRGPVRGPLRQEGRCSERSSRLPSADPRDRGGRRCALPASALLPGGNDVRRGGRPGGRARRARVAPRRPRGARGRAAGQAAQPAVRRAQPDHRGQARLSTSWSTTSRRPASSRPRTRPSPPRPRRWPSAARRAEEQLRRLLVPRDPTDDKDAILEVKSGEGGEESALFAGDLLRMYTRYAETQGLAGRDPRRHRVRPRRLQVGHRSR